MIKENLIIIFKKNSGKIIGSLIGLVLAIFILTIGLFKTLFIVALMAAGYFIGNKIEKKESIIDFFKEVLEIISR